MDYRKKFVVEPGTKVRLSRSILPTPASTKPMRKRPRNPSNLERMGKLQYLLYADGDQSLLVVLQALDAAGKDGVIRHLFSGINPQGTSVFGFKQPSKDGSEPTISYGAHMCAPRPRARW